MIVSGKRGNRRFFMDCVEVSEVGPVTVEAVNGPDGQAQYRLLPVGWNPAVDSEEARRMSQDRVHVDWVRILDGPWVRTDVRAINGKVYSLVGDITVEQSL